MFNIKNFGMGIGLSAVAAMMLTNQANGLINVDRDESTSYSSYKPDEFDTTIDYDYDYYYDEYADYDDIDDNDNDGDTDHVTLEDCRIYEPSDISKENDEKLMDMTAVYLEEGYEVYNLFDLSNQNTDLALSDWDDMPDYLRHGLYVTDRYVNPNICTYVVKCTKKEYRDFKTGMSSRWEKEKDYSYYYYFPDNTYHTIRFENGYMFYTIKYHVEIYG